MKIKYTKFQVILEIIGAMIIAAFFIFLITNWSYIPEKIPGHFNASGEITRWGNKSEILFAPIVGVIIYIGITVLTFFPEIWNVPTSKRKENQQAVYRTIKTMILLLKIEMISVYFYITYFSAKAQALPKAFLPINLLVIFSSLIYFTFRSIYISK
jgi:uncharacterized membrane protein